MEEDSLDGCNDRPIRTLPEDGPSIEESLTLQQRRKDQMESDLSKLTNIKKLTPSERRAIDELEQNLYQVNSQIAGLKRKIRHRY